MGFTAQEELYIFYNHQFTAADVQQKSNYEMSITFEQCSHEHKPGTGRWCQSVWGRVLLRDEPELRHERTLCSVQCGTGLDPAPELQSVNVLMQRNTLTALDANTTCEQKQNYVHYTSPLMIE